MSNRRELAEQYFLDGYNCSQAIVLTFSDLLEIDKDTLLKIASPFGGGMGRLREVCGSVSGMFMVVGLLYGYSTPETGAAKAELYERIQTLAKTYENQNGSIVCRELLGLNVKHDDATPEPRTKEYYKNRPCKEKIGDAAEILEKYIEEHPIR